MDVPRLILSDEEGMGLEYQELEEILVEGARKFQVVLNRSQVELFFLYLEKLRKGNQEVNLTSITERREIVIKHFLDSLSCLSVKEIGERVEVVDIGSGAGFPGLPLKISRPDLKVVFLEATRKKANFLKQTLAELQLDQVKVVNMRVEEFAQDKEERSRYDVAVSRALAPLSVILEYALPLLKLGGILIAQKGRKPVEESVAARKACQIIGGEIEEVREVEVPYLQGSRHLVIARKIRSTSGKFPRRPGIPRKKPLGFERFLKLL